MANQERISWQLLRYAPPTAVDELWCIYRIISITSDKDGYTNILVDDHIEDPVAAEFFVVLKDLGKNEWLCYYHGQYVYCQRISMGFKGNSYLDASYFYCPYVPLMTTPVLPAQPVDKSKGILTKFGKKLLAQAGKVYGR